MIDANTRFPGRPNYTGPREGWFAFLHHGEIAEYSHDVVERIDYVRQHKPAHEIPIRLHNMMWIGDWEGLTDYLEVLTDYRGKCDALAVARFLAADYLAKHDAIDADYWAKRRTLDADYRAKCNALAEPLLSFIRTHIPDCAWNGKKLDFGDADQ